MNKEEILEQLSITHQGGGFSPLAGKILGVFYLSNDKYLTFNDLVEITGATKGAVSKALKSLKDKHRVDSILDPNSSRKRLFYLDSDGISTYMDLVVQNMTRETELIDECVSRRNDNAPDIKELMSKTVTFNKEIIQFLKLVTHKYFPKD
ncbi:MULTISPECIES: GbsR/MarR family transcriptional regulator [Flammeovirga]|uniref:MarR family transcriptional regulator n=1 Tax=Flammeovirga agarivorans TaxID=2726742 RepID=A0A7X8SPA4_9BACT|nr:MULTISPECIES: hypothetical protein [Flammeovirga]NLR93900.1 hypothetical protein [Flammeovirga agarivorans]